MIRAHAPILLADDHRVFREGLKALVETQTDMKVVDEADDGRAAWPAGGRSIRPDVVIMDVTMPRWGAPRRPA